MFETTNQSTQLTYEIMHWNKHTDDTFEDHDLHTFDRKSIAALGNGKQR